MKKSPRAVGKTDSDSSQQVKNWTKLSETRSFILKSKNDILSTFCIFSFFFTERENYSNLWNSRKNKVWDRFAFQIFQEEMKIAWLFYEICIYYILILKLFYYQLNLNRLRAPWMLKVVFI